jgi:hypothetical protein
MRAALLLVASMAVCSCTDPGDASTGPGATAPAARPDALLPIPPVPSTTTPFPDATVPLGQSSVLMVGDSTLLAVQRYDAMRTLQGALITFDAQSCRTLGVPSCGDPPTPTNAVEAIVASTGPFDIVVVMAGYDEWWTSFPSSFDEVNDAARSTGAHTIVWLTYREGVGYTAPDGATANEAFVRNNVTLRRRAASGADPDVVLADWAAYTATPRGWLADDGIHLTARGALALGDYLSRTLAHLEDRPCPMPWIAGGPIDAPCPLPDTHEPVGDIDALYS